MKLFWSLVLKKKYLSGLQSGKTLRILKSARTFCENSVKPPHRYQVLVSKSDNIFTNLALEEWLYENLDLLHNSVLLMWKNKPCIVIGRHQNPWLECNVSEAVAMGVDVVRRGSGGGTVYHDDGNLNCSFIAHRSRYDRRRNLEFVINAIKQRWDIDLEVNNREDIVLDHLYKVSGTASRLTRNKTFHHFTLLYNADTEKLQKVLRSPFGTGVNSNATQSLSAQVKNMAEYATDMDFNSLVHVIGRRFFQNGLDLEFDPKRVGEVQYIDPCNNPDFPGLDKLQSNLESWGWIYGKTPKFSLKKYFRTVIAGEQFEITVSAEIHKGQITVLNISKLNSCKTTCINAFSDSICDSVTGVRFWPADMSICFRKLERLKFSSVGGNHRDMEIFKWIVCCVKDTLYF